MTLITLLLVWVCVQWWGSGGPIQQDAWFQRWATRVDQFVSRCNDSSIIRHFYWLPVLIIVVLPSLAVALMLALLTYWLGAFTGALLAVPVLLYALGRGDYNQTLEEYLQAYDRKDSVKACHLVASLHPSESPSASDLESDNWDSCHRHALAEFGYSAFERMFAVIVWFVILGPFGALLYRFLQLYRQQTCAAKQALVKRCLWYLEWPAVRLLGLSWALVGNFVGCFSQWQLCFMCAQRSSKTVLLHYLQGALGVGDATHKDAGEPSTDIRQIEALSPLMSRSLWLWFCVIAGAILLW